MQFENVLKVVQCSLAKDGHILECAIPLSCGHHICKKCLPANNNYQFTCHKCGEINQMNLSLCKESEMATLLIQSNLVDLSTHVKNKLQIEIDALKNTKISWEEFYNTKIQVIRDDIDIRIESLIAELHHIRDSLNTRLDHIKETIIRKFNEMHADETFLMSDESQLYQDIPNTLSDLYKYQNDLHNMRARNKLQSDKPFLIDFSFSQLKLVPEDIGELDFCELGTSDCKILSSHEICHLIRLCDFGKPKIWRLLYRASDDGFESKKFHEKCDNIGSTLVIVKTTNGNVFGGFTTQAWSSNCTEWKRDDNAFLFSLKNLENRPEKLFIRAEKSLHAIYNSPDLGPSFGGGCDIKIMSCSNTNMSSYSSLGSTYACQSKSPKAFLAGTYNFQTSDIEVFALRDK